jgi:hypothetical protein
MQLQLPFQRVLLVVNLLVYLKDLAFMLVVQLGLLTLTQVLYEVVRVQPLHEVHGYLQELFHSFLQKYIL